jgi:hypothetical protein
LRGAACCLAGVVATPASAALPRTYDVQRVDSPVPTAAAGFGGGVAAIGDLNGDGRAEFATGQNAGSPGGSGQVFIFNGATGALLDTIVAPDAGGAGSAALFGIPFTDRLPDIGSCPGRTNGQLCTNPIGPKDGVPDLLIGARGVDAGGVTDTGRVYVFDGATRALMKRIDMPPADRTALGISSGGTWFGRVAYSPGALPPCTGNLGVGGCATLPTAVTLGDFDGGGAPDIVVGASRYTESPATAFPGSHCANTAGATCVGAGRTYVYRGEDVAASDPGVTLETALRTLRNPAAQADDPTVFDVTARRELFGNAITAVGDVGGCTTPAITAGDRCPFTGISTTLDGRPEMLVSAFRVDGPVNAPDGSMPDVGVNFLYDGATGALLTTYSHPEPQPGAVFGTPVGGLAVGDLGGDTTRPDVYLPAVTQSRQFKAQGRGYVMSGDLNAFTSTLNFALLDDPTPAVGGNFGGATRRSATSSRRPARPATSCSSAPAISVSRAMPTSSTTSMSSTRSRARCCRASSIPTPSRAAGSAPTSRRSATSTPTGSSTSWRRRHRGRVRQAPRRAASTSCAATTRRRHRRHRRLPHRRPWHRRRVRPGLRGPQGPPDLPRPRPRSRSRRRRVARSSWPQAGRRCGAVSA